jgi:predicted dehydrogenase
MKKVKIGIIGCGQISHYHINSLKKLNQDIIGICDSDKKRGIEVSKNLNCDYFENPDELLKINELDCVIISTPNYTHYPLIIKAIEYNKHIFCEKPMTTNPENSYDVYQKIKKSGLIMQVGYMRRHNPAFKKLKEIISRFEKIYNASVTLYTYSSIYDLKKIKHWSQDTLKSGGYFLPHSGSHLIDLIRFLFSDPIAVLSKVYYLKKDLDIGVSAIFEFKDFNLNFNINVLNSPNLLNSKTFWEEKIEVVGNLQRVCLYNFSWTGEKKIKIEISNMNEKRKKFFNGFSQWKNQMKHFIDSVKKKQKPQPDAFDGYMVDLIIDKIRKSHTKKMRIEIL